LSPKEKSERSASALIEADDREKNNSLNISKSTNEKEELEKELEKLKNTPYTNKGKSKIDSNIYARINEITDILADPQDLEAKGRKENREEEKNKKNALNADIQAFGRPQVAVGNTPGVSAGGKKSKSKKSKSKKSKSKKSKSKKSKSKKSKSKKPIKNR